MVVADLEAEVMEGEEEVLVVEEVAIGEAVEVVAGLGAEVIGVDVVAAVEEEVVEEEE